MDIRALRTAACALLLAAPGSTAFAEGGDWQHTVAFYGMGAAIDGDVQIGDLSVAVDVSMSDVLDALEFGAMGAYRADNGTWSWTVDATYMGLGGQSESERGLVKGNVDVDQMTLMGTVGRRWTEHFEALFSLAYFDLSTDLKVRRTAPVTGDVTVRTASVDASWVDPLVGLQYSLPFRDAWRFNLRGDVGGFGVGSDLSYQVLVNARWQSAGGLGVVFGYRLIGFDYEDGNKGSRNYQRFDLTEQGPLLGVTYAF
jgi:hypothetical protein